MMTKNTPNTECTQSGSAQPGEDDVMETKKSPFSGEGSGARQKRNTSHDHNSAEGQRQRLSRHLQTHGSITTCEARRELDILAPACRIMELRRSGLKIDLVWVDDFSEVGKVHKVGRYLLAGGE